MAHWIRMPPLTLFKNLQLNLIDQSMLPLFETSRIIMLIMVKKMTVDQMIMTMGIFDQSLLMQNLKRTL